jgi:hypothetical protein
MKKILIAAAVVALPFASMAQSGFKLGAKAGLNMANIVGTDILETSSKMGFHVGPMAHYGFGDEGNFSVLAELLFDMKGYKVDDKPFALNYIDVPILARYRFGFGMYLETGFYFGFLMSASYDGESEFDTVDNNGNATKEKYKDSVNGSDFGYCAGIGYIHQSGFGIGYRWNLGLADINKSSDEDIDVETNINSVGQISLMYYFNWED